MEKYIFKDFPDKTTPFSANVFNEIQDNIETEINNSGVVVSATEPQGESRKKVWIQKGKNLFNKDNVLTGYRLDYSGGNFADTNYFISEYIPVVANQKYSVNYVVSALNRVCWYDSNKTMINYTNTYSTVEMPSNAKYIRLCGEKSALDTVQLEQNDTSSPYEAYVEPKIYVLNNNGVYEEFVEKKETTGEILWQGEAYQANTGMVLSRALKENKVYVMDMFGISSSYHIYFTFIYTGNNLIQFSYNDGTDFFRYRFVIQTDRKKITIQSESVNNNENTKIVKIFEIN